MINEVREDEPELTDVWGSGRSSFGHQVEGRPRCLTLTTWGRRTGWSIGVDTRKALKASTPS